MDKIVKPTAKNGKRYVQKKRIYENIKSQMGKTYQVTTQVSTDVFKAELIAKGWTQLENYRLTPTLLHYDTYEREKINEDTGGPIDLYKPATIKNKTIDNYTEKHALWQLKPMRAYMKNSDIITPNYSYGKLKKWNYPILVKPSFGHAGEGIYIADNYSNLLKDIDRVKKETKDPIIVTEYILNPLLYKGLKFHIRIHWIADTQKRSWMFNEYNIMTAGKPYKREDWSNKLIHDTHRKTTIGHPMSAEFIKEFGEAIYNKTTKQMVEIFKTLNEVSSRQPYEEFKYGYNIHGTDFMITDDGAVVLLEVNRRTGFTFHDETIRNKYATRLFRGLVEIIDAYIENRNPVLNDKDFIQTFLDDQSSQAKKKGKTAKKGGSRSTAPTFFCDKCSSYNSISLSENLKKLGWVEVKDYSDITYYHSDKHTGNDHIYAYIKNVLKVAFTHGMLYKLKNTKRHIPKSVVATKNNYNLKEMVNGPFIIKDIFKSHGKGIHFCDNIQCVKDKLKQLIVNNPTQKSGKINTTANTSFVVSEYINNPFLINGKKFHIRIHWMLDSKHRSWIYENYWIYPALNQYSQQFEEDGELTDSIHNTHYSDFAFQINDVKEKLSDGQNPKELKKIFDDGILTILRDLHKDLPEKYIYDDYKYGYDLYGVDIMFDDKQKPWLLEVNSHPGLKKRMDLLKDGICILLQSLVDKTDPVIPNFVRVA